MRAAGRGQRRASESHVMPRESRTTTALPAARCPLAYYFDSSASPRVWTREVLPELEPEPKRPAGLGEATLIVDGRVGHVVEGDERAE
jgi:hypothetical protein